MKLLVFIFLLAGGCGVAVGLTRDYIFNNAPLVWDQAQSFCRTYYKDLATVTSMEEYNQMLQSGSLFSGSWTGLHRELGVWKWSDGELVSFPNWFRNISFSATSTYGCSVTSTSSVFAENYNCFRSRTFFCYRVLILVKEKKTWEDAAQYCMTHYTGLASVTSESNLSQLSLETEESETESVWTGLRFLNGNWLWMSKEQLGSLVSLPSCPVPPYRCGALSTTTNTLKNQNCNDMLNFICY